MSDTPRTDAVAERLPIYGPSDSEWVNADFARELERENAALRARLDDAVSGWHDIDARLRYLRAEGFDKP